MYQKAIDEYGEETVPAVNATFTVRDWALFRIGLLYKDTGSKNEAMRIFEDLMKHAEDSNTRRQSRIRYLEIKQSE